MPGLSRASGSILGAGLNKAFGDNPDLPNPPSAPALNITTPGFNLTTTPHGDNGAGISLTRSDTFGIDRLRGLIDEVRPGFGRFTEAAVNAVSQARERTTGALRSDLTRRRIIGSSFGQNTLALAEQQFADKENEVRASALINEINTSASLIQRELDDNIKSLSIAANLGAQIGAGINAALMKHYDTQVTDVFGRRAGSAKFFGDLGQDIAGSKEATESAESVNGAGEGGGGGGGFASLFGLFGG